MTGKFHNILFLEYVSAVRISGQCTKVCFKYVPVVKITYQSVSSVFLRTMSSILILILLPIQTMSFIISLIILELAYPNIHVPYIQIATPCYHLMAETSLKLQGTIQSTTDQTPSYYQQSTK